MGKNTLSEEVGERMRRDKIIEILRSSAVPVKGAELAQKTSVSRQVIVQDIALMRAQGWDIIATPQGYLLNRQAQMPNSIRLFACQHEGLAAMCDELETIVTYGGYVRNVVVEHPIYGEISGNLCLGSLYEVQQFMEKVELAEALPLSALTKGVHLHTVEAKNEEILQHIAHILLKKHYLVEDFVSKQEES